MGASYTAGKGLVLTGGEVRVEALLQIIIHKFKDEVEARRLRDDLWKGEGEEARQGERGAGRAWLHMILWKRRGQKARCEGGNLYLS